MKTIEKIPNQKYILKDLAEIYYFGATCYPYKNALKEKKRQLNFHQLQNSSNVVANKMLLGNIKKGDNVVVFAEKRIEIGVIAPAIWKASATYIPVDCELPSDRIQYLLDSLQPSAIFCSDKWLAKNKELIKDQFLLTFDNVADLFNDQEELLKKPENNMDDTAYIIFTSGSTGTPKGAMISHDNLLDYFINHNETFNFDNTSYGFTISPFHFDVSIEDTFLPLSRGSSVYLYKGLPIASLLLRIIKQEKITHVVMVSTILTILTQLKEKIAQTDLSSLQLLMTGAEICDIDIINFWKETFPQIKMINAYGPTETTIVSHCYEIEQPDYNRKTIYPIGKALRNVYSLLIDKNNNVITDKNVSGELLIGGTQVMKGYWKSDEETQKRIIYIDDERYYKSGDICFLDEDQNYNFVGRSDTEIKLNGRRVNLAEIHKQLMALNNIENVVIGVFNDVTDKKVIVTLVTNKMFSKEELDNIHLHLKETLPKYLVPTFIGMTTEKLLSSTGKNDDKRINKLLETAIKNSTSYHKYYTFSDGNFIGL